jgi:beta-1,4-mannosyl-glycoprotein beta-1,4-N-acetylglucosaminyltransferase
LHSITELRNIKTKKYGWWRLDTFFKKDKFINLKIVDNGGWHFAEIKSPEEIYEKHKNDEHHDEFELTGIKLEDVRNMIKNRYIPYNHKAEKKNFDSRWGKDIKVHLSKVNEKELPSFLVLNKKKYSTWFDGI